MSIPEHLQANYRELANGESWESIAHRLDSLGNTELAAWCREQAPKLEPKAERATGKKQTAAASKPTETA